MAVLTTVTGDDIACPREVTPTCDYGTPREAIAVAAAKLGSSDGDPKPANAIPRQGRLWPITVSRLSNSLHTAPGGLWQFITNGDPLTAQPSRCYELEHVGQAEIGDCILVRDDSVLPFRFLGIVTGPPNFSVYPGEGEERSWAEFIAEDSKPGGCNLDAGLLLPMDVVYLDELDDSEQAQVLSDVIETAMDLSMEWGSLRDLMNSLKLA